MPRFAPADATTLTTDEFDLAMQCVEDVFRHRAVIPGAFLVILLGKFRDDVREAQRKSPLVRVDRGSQNLPLSSLDDNELATLTESVRTLIDQFGVYMDDPELRAQLRRFRETLLTDRVERDKAQEASGDEA